MSNVTEITEILNMPHGSRIIYHVGHIAIDARNGGWLESRHKNLADYTEKERERIQETKLLAQRFSDSGKVHLVQRRIDTHVYEYIAEKI